MMVDREIGFQALSSLRGLCPSLENEAESGTWLIEIRSVSSGLGFGSW